MILITGTSNGIGKATAMKFVRAGLRVIGFDIQPATFSHPLYTHYQVDVSDFAQLPELPAFKVVINNAGTIDEDKAMDVNYRGYVNIVNKYCYQPKLECLINVASISGHIGLDTPNYAASQGARLALTKHLAMDLGKRYKARVNSFSPGAVITNLEPELYANKEAMQRVANENILKKWMQPEEVAEWLFFIALVDKSMTGQDILVDNGEVANYNFISSR
jgi:NAD(P)-dependent dehydrogenase (short-subunit alcohol dehydrogenase family)